MLQYSSRIRADSAVVQLIRVGDVVVPLIAVILPGNIGGDQLSPMLGTEDGGIVNTVLFAFVSV